MTGWLTLNAVAAHYGVRRQTIREWVASGKFPKPITLPGGRQIRFDSREVEKVDRDWLAARRAA